MKEELSRERVDGLIQWLLAVAKRGSQVGDDDDDDDGIEDIFTCVINGPYIIFILKREFVGKIRKSRGQRIKTRK